MGPFRSVIKSIRLRRLQNRLQPRNLSASERVQSDLFSNERDAALAAYLDFCQSDPNVRAVMRRFGIDRSKLEQIYARLLLNGLGGWIGGHFAAASSIAYAEPLAFVLESEGSNVSFLEVCSILFDYWNGDIPVGGLPGISAKQA